VERVNVLVVGAGQAGLALSVELARRGVEPSLLMGVGEDAAIVADVAASA
jgi:cation diffusion facilitator CzcD-associated flavoprotein CzcO